MVFRSISVTYSNTNNIAMALRTFGAFKKKDNCRVGPLLLVVENEVTAEVEQTGVLCREVDGFSGF
jgi:hypothetical protein